MNANNTLVNSIENVRNLIENSILMLRDLDKCLSKHNFIPIYGNALGTETSKSIFQSPDQYATFFPQYMARQYVLKNDLDSNNVSKIIFVNIQFYHPDHAQLVPTFLSGIIVFPKPVENIKSEVGNWWLKNIAFEYSNWEDLNKDGESNEIVDDSSYKNIFWSKDLTLFDGQQSISDEAEKLVKYFHETI